MESEEFEQIEALFHAACELLPELRAGWLEEHCADERIRREVLGLLEQDTPVDGLASSDAAGSEEVPRVPTKIGRYEVLSRLGAGGMGVVYRALDPDLGREVAIKLLPQGAASEEAVLRLRREAAALAALDHPNIVTLLSIETEGGLSFLTMSLLDGQTLDRHIPPEGMDVERMLETAITIVGAVAAAHDAGLVHRDLKPDNIMVGREGRIRVFDFGLAKTLEAGGEDFRRSASLTRAGTLVGTPNYMAPEQIEGGTIDMRTDVFALGVLLHEMATGRRPFGGSTLSELLFALVSKTPAPVSESRPDVPEGFDRVVLRCLEKRPADRFASARALLDELVSLRHRPPSREGPYRPEAGTPEERRASAVLREGEGFWIAVMPFVFRTITSGLDGFSMDLAEEIRTGLARFSYLRVIARSSTQRYADRSMDVRQIGRELGARYVLEGSIRQAGSRLRIGAQLVDATSGAHVWAETYDREFRPDEAFELLDQVAARIVSTTADMHGVLPHVMSERLRDRDPQTLTPYECVLRSFGYIERLTAEEHAEVRALMERAAREAPKDAEVLAMLSFVYAEEFKHGFNERPRALDRALDAARRAVTASPSNHLCYHVLAQTLFFRRELEAFRNAAERAVELNPMDGGTIAFMGILLGYAGDWERGPALAARARELNPNHPGWYHFSDFFDAYRRRHHRQALEAALRINLPGYFYAQAALAMAYGQLGDEVGARAALAELLVLKPDFAKEARSEWRKWLGDGELLEHSLDGLRKAGLRMTDSGRPSVG